MTKIENALIKSTMLGIEDHGCFTAYVFVDGDGWGCGFGGYALDQWYEAKGKRVGTAYGLEFVMCLLEALGVESWEKLPGTICRVETEGPGGKIVRIGHPIKNKWFDPRELSASFTETKP